MALWAKARLCVKSSLLEQSLPGTPSRLKTSALSAFSAVNNLCNLWLLFCAFLWLKNPFNQRNLRLMNYLHACKALYICRDTSTGIENSLQIRLFMQNKPNFRKSQMNVNKVLTKDYENKTLGERGKKQSQTKPIKANFKKAEMNVTVFYTKAYENISPIMAPKKQSQFSKRQKTIQTSLPKGIMKKTAFSGSDKTNPIQTQSNPIKPNFKGKKILPRMTINGRRKPYTSPTTGAWSNPGPARGQFAKVDPPTLILHGTLDALVPINQSYKLVKRLKEVVVPYTYDRLAGWPHVMDIAEPVYKRCLFFIDRFLAEQMPVPTPEWQRQQRQTQTVRPVPKARTCALVCSDLMFP